MRSCAPTPRGVDTQIQLRRHFHAMIQIITSLPVGGQIELTYAGLSLYSKEGIQSHLLYKSG